MTAPVSRLLLADSDLSEALQYMKAFDNPASLAYPIEVRRALKVAAIVAYCRPFSGNKGEHGKRTDNLPVSDYIQPGPEQDLHNEVMKLRNELIAHTHFDAKPNGIIRQEAGITESYFTMFDLLDHPVDIAALIALTERILSVVETQHPTILRLPKGIRSKLYKS